MNYIPVVQTGRVFGHPAGIWPSGRNAKNQLGKVRRKKSKTAKILIDKMVNREIAVE